MNDFTLTEESARKVKALINEQRYQAPTRHHNTRPTDNGAEWVEFVIVSMTTKTTGPFTGLKAAMVKVKGGSETEGTDLEVIDHSGNNFDAGGSMAGYTGWAMPSGNYLSLESGVASGTLAPWHWAAITRACAANTGVYATRS